MDVIEVNPVISVIVPVYKVEKYLRQCVDSILGQTFADFELILVNDGSPDGCPAICDEYAAKDSRIVAFHGTNAGVSAARNKGIDLSKGKYIAFVDGDDCLNKDYLRTLYMALTGNHARIAHCEMERFSDIAPILDDESSVETQCVPFAVFFQKQMSGQETVSVCNKLFLKSIFETTRFMLNRRYEDILFWADMLTASVGDVVGVNKQLYYYRQQTTSFMNNQIALSKCSPDRIFAADYLLTCANSANYVYMDECIAYAVKYPWYFVDPIYVHFRFKENKKFLNELQKLIRKNLNEYRNLTSLDSIQRNRMMLFARSKVLYGFNAYARLIRVYIYHVLKKDAYADGHGI